MIQKTFFSLSICLIAGIAMIAILSLVSDNLVRRPGSFLRILPPHPVIQRATFDVGLNSYYIAGVGKDEIFLGNRTAPTLVLKMNMLLSDSQAYRIDLANARSIKFWSTRLQIDAPYFYIFDGTVPVILRGDINTWRVGKVIEPGAYFLDAVPLAPFSFAIKSRRSASGDHVLGKDGPGSNDVRFTDNILEKQIDGQFCVDGMMRFDKATGRLLYTYYYRNQYMVLDSNVNLVARGRTIDTTSRANIVVAAMGNDSTMTLASPAGLVNSNSCVYDRWLFLHSERMARNDAASDFDQVAVIDVYDIISLQYKFSFYLSHFSGARMSDFCATNGKLVAIFGRHIAVFEMLDRFFARPAS